MPRDVSRYHGQAILDRPGDLSAPSPSYYIGLVKRQAVVRGNEKNSRPFGCHDSGRLDIIGVIADDDAKCQRSKRKGWQFVTCIIDRVANRWIRFSISTEYLTAVKNNSCIGRCCMKAVFGS